MGLGTHGLQHHLPKPTMARFRNPPTGNHERGAALIIMMILLLVGGTGLLLSRTSANAPSLARQQSVERALARAREALIAYAVTYPDSYGSWSAGPGRLPCPDLDGDGGPDPCSGNVAGRLPRRITVVVNADTGRRRALRFPAGDELGDQQALWYAVSDGHRNNPATLGANAGMPGGLTVDGVDDIVAVIIAPGPPGAGQTRPSLNRADYLEGRNADADAVFGSDGNDHLVSIGRHELMRRVSTRVAAELAAIVRRYRTACGFYPWAASFADPMTLATYASVPTTLEGLFPVDAALPVDWNSGCADGVEVPGWVKDGVGPNHWQREAYYATASTAVRAGGGCTLGVDCLTVAGFAHPDNDKEALVLMAGPPLPGQDRAAPADRFDYFEGENATALDRRFAIGGNDAVAVIN